MTEKLTEERTIEEGLQELDKIVEKLESREISGVTPLSCTKKEWKS